MKSSKKMIQSVVALSVMVSGVSKAQAGVVDFVKAHPAVAVAGVVAAGAAMVSTSYAYAVPPVGCQLLPTLERGVCEVARAGLGVREIGNGVFASAVACGSSVAAAGKVFFSEDSVVSEKFRAVLGQGQSLAKKYLGLASACYAFAPVAVRWVFEGEAKGAVVKIFERTSRGGIKLVKSFF